MIEKLDFGDSRNIPIPACLKGLQKLSEDRAEEVKKAVLNYAKAKNIRLDPNQFQARAAG